jgi:hypothetical protein
MGHEQVVDLQSLPYYRKKIFDNNWDNRTTE